MADDIVLVQPVLPAADLVRRAVSRVFDSGVITNDGPRVRAFEQQLSDRLGCQDLAVCASGTTAIQLACGALRLTGEVIVPAAAFPAVWQAVLRAGAKPVGVDVEPTYLTLDPQAVEAAITPATCAVLAVHTFGCPADIDELTRIAGRADVPLVFDAATCWGIGFRGRPLLSYGDVATLSLHAMKLTHSVEGGAVVGNGLLVADWVRRLRNFGIGGDGALAQGTNARMSELHAAIGEVVLAESDMEITRRVRVRRWYEDGLAGIDWLTVGAFRPEAGPNVAAMPIMLNPDAPVDATTLCQELHQRGIHARAYFTGHYRPNTLRLAGAIPVAHDIANRLVCLPFWGRLTEQHVARVIAALTEIGTRHAPAVHLAGHAAAPVSPGAAGLGGSRGRP
ncbi:MAG TPA: DegT/DnrJ/EryC1/StrS family aminotransferase [Kutzneria sp.]|jgi:dTDP-4-amino-4,6-dideoxygalactose transaminase